MRAAVVRLFAEYMSNAIGGFDSRKSADFIAKQVSTTLRKTLY